MRCAVVIFALTLASCGSSAASSSRSSSSTTGSAALAHCGPASARTLAASSLARVYASGPGVYGCSQRTGHTSRLGQSTACLSSPKVTVAAVAGELAAYGLQKCGVDTGAGSLVLRRLSDGRQLRVFEAISGPVGPESYRSVGSVAVKADGAVAWIGVASSIISHRSTLEVQSVDANGHRILDTSAKIQAGSLRLHGSTVTWTDGGRTRSASLQ